MLTIIFSQHQFDQWFRSEMSRIVAMFLGAIEAERTARAGTVSERLP
jgi:hypothetical protein